MAVTRAHPRAAPSGRDLFGPPSTDARWNDPPLPTVRTTSPSHARVALRNRHQTTPNLSTRRGDDLSPRSPNWTNVRPRRAPGTPGRSSLRPLDSTSSVLLANLSIATARNLSRRWPGNDGFVRLAVASGGGGDSVHRLTGRKRAELDRAAGQGRENPERSDFVPRLLRLSTSRCQPRQRIALLNRPRKGAQPQARSCRAIAERAVSCPVGLAMRLAGGSLLRGRGGRRGDRAGAGRPRPSRLALDRSA